MRTIQAPGIELNEIDKSLYNNLNIFLDDAPVCLICGFADKGENYSVKYINNKQTLLLTYGLPETEYEKYFYNGCLEIINNGGICLATRLPYDNLSLDKFTYCDYIIDTYPKNIGNILDIENYSETIADIRSAIQELINTTDPFIEQNNITPFFIKFNNLNTIKNIIDCLNELVDCCKENNLMLDYSETLTKVNDLIDQIKELIKSTIELNKENYCHLRILDSNLTTYMNISSDNSRNGSGLLTLKQFDDLKVGNISNIRNKIRIVDISRSNYEKTSQSTISSLITTDCTSTIVETNDCLGVVPVIVSPVNALYFQELLLTIGEYANELNFGDSAPGSIYNEISLLSVVNSPFMYGDKPTLSVNLESLLKNDNLVMPLSSSTVLLQSLSKIAALLFPNIIFKDAEHLDQTYLKHIGIVVFKAFRDNANSGQINFLLLESFVGSLDKNAKDPTTGASIFIDKIVNTQSSWINVFTNIPSQIILQASILTTKQNTVKSLGFYTLDLVKQITLQTSIIDPLNKLFAKVNNYNEYPLDLIIDAGVSNIAQYIYLKNNVLIPNSYVQKLESFDDAKIWQLILLKYDNFCKYTRKDCMFIADGHRAFCLINDSKIVRDTDPNSSVQNNILPKLKYMAGLNSSYSAGYCNWFYTQDEYSGDFFWCPPSIKVVRSYIYCDTYCHQWSVPAGLRRGRLPTVIDVAFLPNINEAGKIYSLTWNYAMSYPSDGIIIEGQKTFQKAYTALDRINVRRLMLYLEKSVVRIARRFVYEGNTAYLRLLFVDTIIPIFDDAVNNNGILEYAIKCDDELNTAQVIENNEMRCRIAVKPVKALEFLILDFIVTNQTANVNEVVSQ